MLLGSMVRVRQPIRGHRNTSVQRWKRFLLHPAPDMQQSGAYLGCNVMFGHVIGIHGACSAANSWSPQYECAALETVSAASSTRQAAVWCLSWVQCYVWTCYWDPWCVFGSQFV